MTTRTATFQAYLQLMRFDKPVGTLLVLWPTLWGLWFAAGGIPKLSILIIFIAGVIVMRAAGCVINDFADRRFDAHVKRTAQRPLAQQRITPRAALILFISLTVFALALVLFLNALSISIALGAFVLASVYPFMKRVTHWPQLVLGLAFSCSILMAFAAVQNHIPLQAWILFIASTLWTMAYDTEYAMIDRADDIKIGIGSTAILFGRFDRLAIGLLQLSVLGFLLFANQSPSIPYLLALGLAGGLFAYQQRLIAQRDTAACFRAFLNNQWVGLLIFIGIALSF